MKKLSFLILLLFPNLAFCQNDKNVIYYLNGKEFRWERVFINPSSVKSLDVATSRIYFETKEKEWKYRSLSELVKTLHNYPQIISDSITPVFIIQGKVFDEPDSIKIDYTYYAHALILIYQIIQKSGIESEGSTQNSNHIKNKNLRQRLTRTVVFNKLVTIFAFCSCFLENLSCPGHPDTRICPLTDFLYRELFIAPAEALYRDAAPGGFEPNPAP